MEITNILFVSFLFLALTLSVQVSNAEENNAKETAKPPGFNPLKDLILNQNKNGPKSESLARVKRQYGPYYGSDSESDNSESDEYVEASSYAGQYPDYYPVPIILPVGFGGFGVFGGGIGRGFGGRGFGGGGFGGRGFGGRGFGGQGFGGRGFGGRGFGGGFGGRGIGGGFGGGRGRG